MYPPPTSASRPCLPLALAIGGALLLPAASRAERLFTGIMEVDSLRSIDYSVTAFSRTSELPFVRDSIHAWLEKTLLIPSLAGVSQSDMLRVVQCADLANPSSDDNPANVALLPLDDDGTAARQALAAAYAVQTQGEHDAFTLFESPADTNRPARAAIAVSGRHIFVSPSLPALAWAWENRAKLLGAPRQTLPGTFRVFVNPQRFADLFGGEKTSSLGHADALIREFETLSLSFTLDGSAAALTLQGPPKPGTALAALADSLSSPAETLWNAIPDNALLASLGLFARPDLWEPVLADHARLLRPFSPHVPQTALEGERLLYVATTRDGKGLCLVLLVPVSDPGAVQDAIRNLAAPGKTEGGVSLTHRGQRQADGTTIETYALSLPPPPAQPPDDKPASPSFLHPILAILFKQAVLETAVANGHLVAAVGPEGAIEAHLPPPSFTPKTLALNKKIGGLDPALNDRLAFGGTVRAVDLFRQAISIMPEISHEQIRQLPKGGDGASFGITRADRVLTVSLRLHTNEIAALQRINRDGRVVLQEILFQAFTRQMMEQQKAESK